jgi:hypothetical protein
MILRTNNIAPTIVGFALLVAITPVVFLAVYLIRLRAWRSGPLAWAQERLGEFEAEAQEKGFWTALEEYSHARLP